jgi:phage tail-like protein
MKLVAVFLCAVALCGTAFAQDIQTYKDGEDGVNRTRPGNHKPGKTEITKDWSNTMPVEIDGVPVAGVHTSSDLNALREQASREKARPENHKPGKIVLTKDWSNTMEWYQWHKNVLDGKTDRRSVSIIFHNDAGAEVGRMIFYNCWPVKHTLPSPEAKNSGHATETIELSYEWLEWKAK